MRKHQLLVYGNLRSQTKPINIFTPLKANKKAYVCWHRSHSTSHLLTQPLLLDWLCSCSDQPCPKVGWQTSPEPHTCHWPLPGPSLWRKSWPSLHSGNLDSTPLDQVGGGWGQSPPPPSKLAHSPTAHPFPGSCGPHRWWPLSWSPPVGDLEETETESSPQPRNFPRWWQKRKHSYYWTSLELECEVPQRHWPAEKCRNRRNLSTSHAKQKGAPSGHVLKVNTNPSCSQIWQYYLVTQSSPQLYL